MNKTPDAAIRGRISLPNGCSPELPGVALQHYSPRESTGVPGGDVSSPEALQESPEQRFGGVVARGKRFDEL